MRVYRSQYSVTCISTAIPLLTSVESEYRCIGNDHAIGHVHLYVIGVFEYAYI